MNLKNIHLNARNKLAITYLALIMIMSLMFSVVFYHETTQAASSGFRRQVNMIRGNIYFAPPAAIDRIRQDGYERFRNNVLARLVLLNIGMFVVGAYVSYFLAKRSLEPLEEAMDAQDRFTSDAAHELRTPLTAMKTEIEVSLRNKKLQDDDAREVLQSNLEEIAKLETLTAALLRLAKNSHRPDESTWQRVVITDVLNAAYDRVKVAAKQKSIDIELPVASKESLRADYDQLVELFVTLLDNAIKYGSEKTTVTVSALKDESNIVIKVTDKGMGINEKDLPHIFERFYRADHSRNKITSTGYGLGLSVAEAIVTSHRGTISAMSKVGHGTTFIVTLPRAS